MEFNEIQFDNREMHIRVTKEDVGGYCLLPGDPGRTELIASYLEDPKKISSNREYTVYSGRLNGEKISVCSTGIGGPSTAIAVEELVHCGVHTFIRIGTCGGMQLDVKSGDMIVATGAVRQEGTTHEYAPAEFPAVPDLKVTNALIKACCDLGITCHAGIVQSKDSFYGQHQPDRMPLSSTLLQKWDAWKKLGVLGSEMECSTLFVVGNYLKVRTGAVLLAIWNQERVEAGLSNETILDTNQTIKVAVEAMKTLIGDDKKTK